MDFHISRRRIIQVALIGILMSILAGGAYFFLYLRFQPRVEIKEFAGILKEVKGNTLSVLGAYKSDSVDISKTPFPAEVLVDKNTKIIRIVVKYPSYAEIKKNGGRIDWSKTTKDEQIVTIEQLRLDSIHGDIGVLIEARYNIYRYTKFTANVLSYEVDQY